MHLSKLKQLTVKHWTVVCQSIVDLPSPKDQLPEPLPEEDVNQLLTLLHQFAAFCEQVRDLWNTHMPSFPIPCASYLNDYLPGGIGAYDLISTNTKMESIFHQYWRRTWPQMKEPKSGTLAHSCLSSITTTETDGTIGTSSTCAVPVLEAAVAGGKRKRSSPVESFEDIFAAAATQAALTKPTTAISCAITAPAQGVLSKLSFEASPCPYILEMSLYPTVKYVTCQPAQRWRNVMFKASWTYDTNDQAIAGPVKALEKELTRRMAHQRRSEPSSVESRVYSIQTNNN